jgi:transcriptional regulator with XRE-family HTH domain
VKTDIGKRIRQARQMRSLSQENIAEAIGMSAGNFGKIERGEVALNIDNLEKIAIYLEMPVSQLLLENQANEDSPDYPLFSTEDLAKITQNHNQVQLEISQLKLAITQLQEEIKQLRKQHK